ncbi:DUF1212-domain-containing protein [Xylariaceae sp. FL0804]|nr:DUF1212-domain-containing protein [Xylariaceae sp. FL0804]
MEQDLEKGPSTPPSPATAASPGQRGGTSKKEKGRVRFRNTGDVSPSVFVEVSPPPATPGTPTTPVTPAIPATPDAEPQAPKPPTPRTRLTRPSISRGSSYNSMVSDLEDVDEDPHSEKAMSAFAAHERAQHVAAGLRQAGAHSAPGSRRTSLDSDVGLLPNQGAIPLDDLHIRLSNQSESNQQDKVQKPLTGEQRAMNAEAYKLVRAHTLRQDQANHHARLGHTAPNSGTVTPSNEAHHEEYVPPPKQYMGSVLSSLLSLYKLPGNSQPSSLPQSRNSQYDTPGSSGTATPNRRKWYDKNRSQDTLANLEEAAARLRHVDGATLAPPETPRRPKHKRSSSKNLFGKPRVEDEVRITMHIAAILSRQKYILQMCKALMLYGAPTHRLEEYLRMSARVLEIDGQFLYLPGCMIISFDDKSTHTTEVKIVRTNQGIELGKLKDVHEVYKSVLHDVYSVDEAIEDLARIMTDGPRYHPWLRVLAFGLASAMVAPFGFDGRLIDLPMCFVLGCAVGALQIIVAPKSDLYSNVFEVSAAVLTSFLSRALGSVQGGKLFCFSAMAQSSIALILPGWFVLCSALELQSRALIPGSIRMVYAIIYSLFLGFGITVGTALWGILDVTATSETTCSDPINQYYRFAFVPIFTVALAYVNQAKWTQMPTMIVIAFAGYIVNFFSGKRFSASPQIANTLGAFTVGVLANLYSRLRHGVAVTALLPAIFVQVPSGLAATGSLLSGLQTANQLNNNTQTVNGTSTVTITESEPLSNVVFNVAASMIQIAIGITLGLFLSALIVYPLGKRRSGLWTL